jgi:hypothetical protein
MVQQNGVKLETLMLIGLERSYASTGMQATFGIHSPQAMGSSSWYEG